MKKICYLIILTIGLFQACAPETELLFDKSASERMSETLRNYQELLVSAPNGWLVEYYPHSSRSYGGFNLFFQFTEEQVTVKTEVKSQYMSVTEATSYYFLGEDMGPTLNFDTYNEVLNYFSDPALNVGGGAGYGLEGDYEFVFMSGDANEIILRGKKTKNTIRLTPFPEDQSWSDYVAEIQSAANTMRYIQLEYQMNGKTIPVKTSYRTLTFNDTDDNGEQVSIIAPFIQTTTGYKLYEPITLAGITVSEFKHTKEGNLDYFVPVEDSSVKMVAVIQDINKVLVSGNWFFKHSGIGTFGQAYWDYTKTNGLDQIGEELYYAYMGTDSQGEYGFNFASYSPEIGSAYSGALHFDHELLNEDQVKLSFAFSGSGNGVWYYNNAAFNYLIYPLYGGGTKTFTLTSDNEKYPAQITLTDTDNPNNTFMLESQTDNTYILEPRTVVWPYRR